LKASRIAACSIRPELERVRFRVLRNDLAADDVVKTV
jgi:hypothetical protein